MKKLIILSALLMSATFANAGFQIVALVTTTNAPNTNGSSFAINGDVRTGTNAISSTTYQTNTSIGGITTNLFRQFVRFKFVGQDYAEWISTNSFKIWMKQGYTVTNDLVGTNFSVALTTNTIGGIKTNVSVPATNSYSATSATNVFTQLAQDLGTYSSIPITVGLSNNVISGQPSFTGANSVLILNRLTTAQIAAVTATIDGLAGALVFDSDILFPKFHDGFSWYALVTEEYLTNGFAPVENAIIRNAAFNGALTNHGATSFTRTNLTTLANGANAAVEIADRTYIKVSGPTATFSIAGIAGGTDGRIVILQNSTGETMEILNDSGLDGTAANRIYTGTSGTITITNNPGIAKFIYDSEDSRWIYTGGN